MKKIIYLFLLVFPFVNVHAQIDFNIGDKVKKKVEDRVNRKVDQGIDKGIDKTEEGVKKESKKDDKKKSDEKSDETKSSGTENNSTSTKPVGLKSYGKFDFMPGDKILVSEDFSQDAIGDFPQLWNTNSTGELVTVEGRTGKWLSLLKEGVFIPEFITALPENFTFEFELACPEDFSYYSTSFSANISKVADAKQAFETWKQYGQVSQRDGVQLSFHPTSAGGGTGSSSYETFDKGSMVMKNDAATAQFHSKTHPFVHVSIWRQKTRLRVYMNEEKVWDLPRAFIAGTSYNNICFSLGSFSATSDRYLISDIKLAVGAPDTRNKLITEGKFSTSGILFDSGSDRIKAESYGVLKDIATVLQENATVKVKIFGHTDSDGEETINLDLSKRRAEAVKNALSSEFNIDKSRMTTDGKGEKEPVADNQKPEGKAQNRRVEFIKL